MPEPTWEYLWFSLGLLGFACFQCVLAYAVMDLALWADRKWKGRGE